MEAKKDFRHLCLPLIEEVQRETEKLIRIHKHNVDGINIDALAEALGEDVDFLSFYQCEGVEFAYKNKRCIIADEMGVGKTAQGLALRYHIENETGMSCRTLVISTNAAKDYWREYIQTYSNQDRIGKLVVLDRPDDLDLTNANNADWVVINYDLLAYNGKASNTKRVLHGRKRLLRWLAGQSFRLVVLDEVQNAKNDARPLSTNVMETARKSEYLLLLSGTPVPNWLSDIFVIMSLVEPDVFPTVNDVRRAYRQDPRIVRAFFGRRRLKRTLAEVANLPLLEKKRVWIELSGEQREQYEEIRSRFDLEGAAKLLRLKQTLLDPALVPASLRIHRGPFRDDPLKYRELDRILAEEIGAGNKVVVFSPLARKGVVSKLEKRYAHYGVITQDGSQEEVVRRELRQRFRTDPDVRLCFATNVVSQAIDLTVAQVVIFLDLPYAPGQYDQMFARVYRRGQTKPVRVYELLIRDSVDEGTVEFLEIKRLAIEFLERGVELTPEQIEVMTKSPGQTNVHRKRMWTAQQYVHWYAMQMAGTGYETNNKALQKHEAFVAKHYAECYPDGWSTGASANSSEICRQIVTHIELSQPLPAKLDIGGAFGVLSHVLQVPTVVTDINPFHFETDFYHEQIAPRGNENVIAPFHKLPSEWTERFDLIVSGFGLHQCQADERIAVMEELRRVIKSDGHLLITIPIGPVGTYAHAFAEGIRQMGWSVSIGGIIRSVDRDIGFQCLVVVAQPNDQPFDIESIDLTLACDIRTVGKTKTQRLHSQRRSGCAKEFILENGVNLQDWLTQADLQKSA